MSVITFVNNRKEETGKTLSLVAIATNMAIENNEKILIISTTNKESKIKMIPSANTAASACCHVYPIPRTTV